MKYAITTTSDTGKKTVATGNEYLDIDITAGNRVIARLTVREGEHGAAVYNEDDRDIKIASCAYNQAHNDGSYCAPCTGHAGTPIKNCNNK